MSTILTQSTVREGQLDVTDDEVIIHRNHYGKREGCPTETRFAIIDIIAMNHEPCGFMSNGKLEFEVKSKPSNETTLTYSGIGKYSVASTLSILSDLTTSSSNPVLMSAQGVNGRIELLHDKVKIKRDGGMAFLSQGIKGDKEIFLSSITSIQFKTSTTMTNGYIQIGFFGGTESKGALFQATRDENSVMFSASQQSDFQRIKSAIEKQRNEVISPKSDLPNSGIDDLEKLANLRDKGILTDDEFNAKKKQILGF